MVTDWSSLVFSLLEDVSLHDRVVCVYAFFERVRQCEFMLLPLYCLQVFHYKKLGQKWQRALTPETLQLRQKGSKLLNWLANCITD